MLDTGEDSFFNKGQFYTKDHNATFNRDDYAVNFGYNTDDLFGGILSFVVGYKVGETEIGGTRRYYINSWNRNSEITKIKTRGPTIGIAYGLPVGKSSILGINVAYAWLDGDYESNQMDLDINPTATTFGINWSSPITNKLTYRIALDSYQYPTQTFPANNRITIDSIKEQIVSLKASLAYRFDL